MRIGLIDIDRRNFPNIALMKLSAYHKQNGDMVEWYDTFSSECYDVAYLSKVFSFSPDYQYYINAYKVVKGGSGYAIETRNGIETYDAEKDGRLPKDAEHIYPDYELYGIKDTEYGFITRGCPRACRFCHVKSKEGTNVYKYADLKEFWRGQKNIVLCDPNILAYNDRERELETIAETGANIDFNQGIDIRLMNERIAEIFKSIRYNNIRFAWDKYGDKEMILKNLEMFARLGKKPSQHNAIVYMLVNFDTTIEQDFERIYTIRDMGYYPFVMIYDKQHCARIYKDMARWVNNRFIFASCEKFENYKNL